MSDQNSSLGGRLKLLPPDLLRQNQRRLYDKIAAQMVPWAEQSGFRAATADGRLLGPFNVMLYSPLIGEASLAITESEQKNTALTPRIREIVILTVGSVWQAAYELYAHTAVAAKTGLDEETIHTLVAGHVPEGLSEEETVAHEFTHMLVSEHKVDAKMYGRAVAAFGEKGLADLVFLAGNYMTVSALLNTFDVPVPSVDPEPEALTEPEQEVEQQAAEQTAPAADI